MEVYRETAQRSTGVKEANRIVIELSPAEKELRNTAISAIMKMDIQDVVKYLSYIKGGVI